MKYTVVFHPEKEQWLDKSAALRRAAAISKFYDGLVKVYDQKGQFIKSFDGRKRGDV